MAATRTTCEGILAFTLPISCQICLGKVKQPVVCPNQHVFCSPCLELWLKRNKQCPACRVDITDENPCKKILGGLNQNEEKSVDNFTNKELRRARVDLLIKEYENEVERLNNELALLQNENEVLTEKLEVFKKTKKTDEIPAAPKTKSTEELSMLVNLTNKLEDATNLYEKVKRDIQNLKKENYSMREANIDLTRENERIRFELTKRSPRKFGRYTVATLETKIKDQEKEIAQLQKALENNDECLEEKETEIQQLKERCAKCIVCKNEHDFEKNKGSLELVVKGDADNLEEYSDTKSGRQKFPLFQFKGDKKGDFDPFSSHSYLPSLVENTINVKDKVKSLGNMESKGQVPISKQESSSKNLKSTTQRLTETDKKRILKEDSSFFLEMPSPLTPSASFGKLCIQRKNTSNKSELNSPTDNSVPPQRSEEDSLEFNFSKEFEGTVDSEKLDSCRKKLKFESDISSFEKPSVNTTCQDMVPWQAKDSHKTFRGFQPSQDQLGASFLPASNDSFKSDWLRKRNFMPRAQGAATTHQDANISYTPELADCIELFKTAEQNIADKKTLNEGSLRTWSITKSSAVSKETENLMKMTQPNQQTFLCSNTPSLKPSTQHVQDRTMAMRMPHFSGIECNYNQKYQEQALNTIGMSENEYQKIEIP